MLQWQGVHHLADAMGSYIRMGGVSFHAFPASPSADTEPASNGKIQPIIKSDAVTISPVVVKAATLADASGMAAEGQQAWLPNKRQKTEGNTSLPVQASPLSHFDRYADKISILMHCLSSTAYVTCESHSHSLCTARYSGMCKCLCWLSHTGVCRAG